ncbi:unnamed protein product [Vicia faba]|uniref:Bulb-type lectin domain-containing protein n=1 Tax=Vicia faba TaxID=3906 RepID=A0AAV1B5W6_VICFA|nr:unnamed protein product [Vicia faba]
MMIRFKIKKQVVLIYYLWVLSIFRRNKQRCLLVYSKLNMANFEGRSVIWMYNRNQPIDISAVLSLNISGVLKIEFEYRKEIIIYSSPQPINNIVATMLDTRNFVLEQPHPNETKSVLWQSFDYPLDILVPTMKLGVNRKTGLISFII